MSNTTLRTKARTICKIRSCSQPARWRVTTSGHPNGDIQAHYCAEHIFVPTWDESPKPYTVTVSGPAEFEVRN